MTTSRFLILAVFSIGTLLPGHAFGQDRFTEKASTENKSPKQITLGNVTANKDSSQYWGASVKTTEFAELIELPAGDLKYMMRNISLPVGDIDKGSLITVAIYSKDPLKLAPGALLYDTVLYIETSLKRNQRAIEVLLDGAKLIFNGQDKVFVSLRWGSNQGKRTSFRYSMKQLPCLTFTRVQSESGDAVWGIVNRRLENDKHNTTSALYRVTFDELEP